MLGDHSPFRARVLRRMLALAAVSLLGACGLTRQAAPDGALFAVEGLEIQRVATPTAPKTVIAGCPTESPDVTTRIVGGFPIELLLTSSDKAGVRSIRIEATGARAVEPARAEAGGAVIAERAGVLTAVWRFEDDALREQRAVRLRIAPDPSVADLREIGVSAEIVDAVDRRSVIPPDGQAPIGIATVLMACPVDTPLEPAL